MKWLLILGAALSVGAAPVAVVPPVGFWLSRGGPVPGLGWVQPVAGAGSVPAAWRVEACNDLRNWQTVLVVTNPFPAATADIAVGVGFSCDLRFFRVCAVSQ